MQNCILTAMCMLRDGDRVLVQDKVGSGWHGINFPGGHVEYGESFTAAIIREFCEETGLTIEAPRLVGIKNWFRKSGERYIVLLYTAEKFSGELRSSDEGEVFWIDRAELSNLKLADGFELMLPVFEDPDVSEMFWPPEAKNEEYQYL